MYLTWDGALLFSFGRVYVYSRLLRYKSVKVSDSNCIISISRETTELPELDFNSLVSRLSFSPECIVPDYS